MADFRKAYQLTKQNEGGYSNKSWDDGGETYAGVSRRYWGNHSVYKEIFTIVDRYKPLRHNQKINDPRLNSLIEQFYEQEFWKKQAKGHLINDQNLANFIYDFTVNSGYAERQINRALNNEFKASLNATNSAVIGTDTLEYLNSFPARSYKSIREARIAYLKTLPDWDNAGEGWMNRIAKYPLEILEYGTNSPDTQKKK